MLSEMMMSRNLTNVNIRVISDHDTMTGSSWVPSQVTIQKVSGETQVQATRLQSPTWIPIIGGMNYCKILSSKGL